MKVLHIFRSRPVELVKQLVAKFPGSTQVALYEGAIDYDKLVAEIFKSDKVICWW